MANLQACFRSQEPHALLEPARVLENVNRHFFDSTGAERFATLFLGIYDDSTRELRYVNCGHVAPLLLRASGELETLAPTATMLGAFRHWQCTEHQVCLRSGRYPADLFRRRDRGGSPSGEDFGEERLVQCLRENQGQTARSLVHAIVDSVTDFSQGSRYDDVTVVAIRAFSDVGWATRR